MSAEEEAFDNLLLQIAFIEHKRDLAVYGKDRYEVMMYNAILRSLGCFREEEKA